MEKLQLQKCHNNRIIHEKNAPYDRSLEQLVEQIYLKSIERNGKLKNSAYNNNIQ